MAGESDSDKSGFTTAAPVHAYRSPSTWGWGMRGKSKGVVLAYVPAAAVALAGFALAELLRWLAKATALHWLATLGVWLSLLAIIVATACAFWVSWRLLRLRTPLVVPPADEA